MSASPSPTGTVPKVKNANKQRSIADSTGNVTQSPAAIHQHADPRPQSVLSLHSCLSSDTVSDILSPLPDDQASIAGQLDPIDEDYISASGGEGDEDGAGDLYDDVDDDDDDADTAEAADMRDEEQKLQSILADQRTKKQELMSLVRELEIMNERCELAASTPPGDAPSPVRHIPVQFERIVPIELVPAARPKSNSSSPAKPNRVPIIERKAATSVVQAPATVSNVHINAETAPPALKPLASAKDDDSLNRKLSEINSLKQKLSRLQDMMNTVNGIEKQNEAPPRLRHFGNGREMYDDVKIPLKRFDNDGEIPDGTWFPVSTRSHTAPHSSDDEPENGVKSVQSTTMPPRHFGNGREMSDDEPQVKIPFKRFDNDGEIPDGTWFPVSTRSHTAPHSSDDEPQIKIPFKRFDNDREIPDGTQFPVSTRNLSADRSSDDEPENGVNSVQSTTMPPKDRYPDGTVVHVSSCKPGAVDSSEEELENRVKSIQSMTQDLRMQSATLAAERDRLREIKNEMVRRAEMKEIVLQDLEEHVDKQQQQQYGRPSRAATQQPASDNQRRVSASSAQDADNRSAVYDDESKYGAVGGVVRTTFNDLADVDAKANFKKCQSEEPCRRPEQAAASVPKRFGNYDHQYGSPRDTRQHKSNAYASASALNDRYALEAGDDMMAPQTQSAEGSVRSEGAKCMGGPTLGHFMPQPMRHLADTSGWRKHGANHHHGGNNSLDGGGPSSSAYGSGAAPSPQHQYGCAHNHAGGGASTASAPPTLAGPCDGDGHQCCNNALLQQLVQSHQQVVNTVNQCNQLLWDQQEEINNLNSAVILLQVRVLSLGQRRFGEPADRAESVPPPPSNNPYQLDGAVPQQQRAQSEHPNYSSQHHQQCWTPPAPPPLNVGPFSAKLQSYMPNDFPRISALAAAAGLVIPNSRPPLPLSHTTQHHQPPQPQQQQQHHYHQQQPAPLSHHYHRCAPNAFHHPAAGASKFAGRPMPAAPMPTQFPLPPAREFRRSDRDRSEEYASHLAPSYLNNHPNSPLFNGPPTNNGAGSAGLPPPHVGAAAAPMFVYHNNNHSRGSNASEFGGANNQAAAGSNNNSNHTIAANLNTAFGMPPLLASQPQQSHQSSQQQQQQQQQPITLNNQVAPGNRANNYWDNFRSYSRQNLLSTNNTPCKSNENVSSLPDAATQPPPPLSRAADSPPLAQLQQELSDHLSAYPRTDNAAAASIQQQGNVPEPVTSQQQQQPHMSYNILPVMDNKYFMHFRNQFHHGQQQAQQQQEQLHQQQEQQAPHEPLFYFGQHNKHQPRAVPPPPQLQQSPSNQQRYNNVQSNVAGIGPPQSSGDPIYDAIAPAYLEFVNMTNQMTDKQVSKFFNAFKDDLHNGITQIMAANEDRPEFLNALYGNLQGFSSPVRARFDQAFQELEQRQKAKARADEDEPVQPSMPQSRAPALPVTTAHRPSYDYKSVVSGIIDEVDDYLQEARSSTETNDMVLQRVATIALRELARRTEHDPAGVPAITRSELLRNMPALDRRRPMRFQMAMMRYLNQVLRGGSGGSAGAAAPQDNRGAPEPGSRRKRRPPQKTPSSAPSAVASAATPTAATAAVTEQSSTAQGACGGAAAAAVPSSFLKTHSKKAGSVTVKLLVPQDDVQMMDIIQVFENVVAIAGEDDESNGFVHVRNDDNEDLAEADQVCGDEPDEAANNGGGGGAAGVCDDLFHFENNDR